MTYGTFQTVIVTALACIGTAAVALRFQARRRDRQQLRRDELWREAMWQKDTGAAPPVLADWERAAFKTITSRLKRQDAGLDIISNTEAR